MGEGEGWLWHHYAGKGVLRMDGGCSEPREDVGDEVVEDLFFNPTRSVFSNAHPAIMVERESVGP